MVAKQGFGYLGVRISHPNGFRAQKLAFGTFQGPKNKVWQWSFPGVSKLSQTNNKLGFQPKKPPQNHPPKERWKNYGNTIEIRVLLVQGQARRGVLINIKQHTQVAVTVQGYAGLD